MNPLNFLDPHNAFGIGFQRHEEKKVIVMQLGFFHDPAREHRIEHDRPN